MCRLGIIGLGGIATRAHLPALRTIPGVQVQAGAEISLEQAARTQRRFGIPHIYDSYEEMLARETLEAVYVCLPNAHHYAAALAALQQGCHVYCEKPVTLSSEQVARLRDEAQQRHLHLMPGYNYRFYPGFQRVRQLIRARRIGKIVQIQGVCVNPGPFVGWDPKSEWHFDQGSGGLLYDLGSHLVDLILFTTAIGQIELISVTTGKTLPGLPMSDNIVALFKGPSDLCGSIHLAWSAPGNITHIQIHGTAGSLIASMSYFEHRTAHGGGLNDLGTLTRNLRSIIWQKALPLLKRQPNDQTYTAIARQFIEAIRGHGSLAAQVEDCIQVHRILETIRQSLEPAQTPLQAIPEGSG